MCIGKEICRLVITKGKGEWDCTSTLVNMADMNLYSLHYIFTTISKRNCVPLSLALVEDYNRIYKKTESNLKTLPNLIYI